MNLPTSTSTVAAMSLSLVLADIPSDLVRLADAEYRTRTAPRATPLTPGDVVRYRAPGQVDYALAVVTRVPESSGAEPVLGCVNGNEPTPISYGQSVAVVPPAELARLIDVADWLASGGWQAMEDHNRAMIYGVAAELAARHDIAVLIHALTAGTMRHSWGHHWGEYAPMIGAIVDENQDIADMWPESHEYACALTCASRLAQSGAGLRMAAEAWGLTPIPGTSLAADVRQAYQTLGAVRLPNYEHLTVINPFMAHRDRATLMPKDLGPSAATLRFRQTWTRLASALRDIADDNDWCEEYEGLAELVASHTITSGLEYLGRMRTYHVDVEVDVEVAVTVRTTATVSVDAYTEDSARRMAVAELSDDHLDYYAIAESVSEELQGNYVATDIDHTTAHAVSAELSD